MAGVYKVNLVFDADKPGVKCTGNIFLGLVVADSEKDAKTWGKRNHYCEPGDKIEVEYFCQSAKLQDIRKQA